MPVGGLGTNLSPGLKNNTTAAICHPVAGCGPRMALEDRHRQRMSQLSSPMIGEPGFSSPFIRSPPRRRRLTRPDINLSLEELMGAAPALSASHGSPATERLRETYQKRLERSHRGVYITNGNGDGSVMGSDDGSGNGSGKGSDSGRCSVGIDLGGGNGSGVESDQRNCKRHKKAVQ